MNKPFENKEYVITGATIKILVEYTKEHKYVVLVSHGFFNMLVAKKLQKIGLKGKRRTNFKHWNATTFSLLS